MRISLILVPVLLLAGCGGSEPAGPSTPPPVTVATVEVSPATASLFAGDSVQLTATPKTSAGAPVSGRTVTWAASPAGVATVSAAGVVLAVAAGQATVTATVDGRVGSAGIAVAVIAPPVSASMGPAGGTLSTPLPDGSSVQLVVPPGALATTTLVGLEPARPLTGVAATLLLRPAGLGFSKPAQLQFLLQAAPATGTIPALTYESAAGPGYLPLFRRALTNEYVAELHGLRAPEPFAAAAGASGPWAASGADAFSASLQNLPLAALKNAAQAALNQFKGDKSVPLAERLNGVMGVLALAQAFPSFQPDGGLLLQQWRTEICTRLDQVVTQFRGIPAGSSLDFPQFFSAVNVVIGWVAIAQALEDPDLALPFQGCTTDYVGALHEKANQFVDWVIADLAARQGGSLTIRFNEFLDTHIPRVLTLQAALESVGLEEFSADLNAAIRRLMNALRSTAWEGCRERNDQAMLARLLDAENTTADELSDYESQDLADDVEECGTEVLWSTRDQGGATVASGKLGGTGAGQVARSVTTGLPLGGSVRVIGLVRVLVCPGDVKQGIPEAINQEQLRISAMLLPAQGVLRTIPVPTSGPGNYLHNDSLIYTPAQLRAAVGLADDLPGTVVVRFERLGLTCSRGFELLPDPARLIEIGLQLEPETCVEDDDLRAGSAAARPAGAACEEPPPPPPPPPPPATGCPSIRVGPGGLPATSDSLQSLTCIGSLMVQSSEPVSLPNLTTVTEAMAIRFPTVSFSAPALSWVGATDISTSTLVSLALPGLSIVSGPLRISGTAISSLSAVGCPTVFDGLDISGNLNLPQSEAVAKANCMTVHGVKTVTGNKP